MQGRLRIVDSRSLDNLSEHSFIFADMNLHRPMQMLEGSP